MCVCVCVCERVYIYIYIDRDIYIYIYLYLSCLLRNSFSMIDFNGMSTYLGLFYANLQVRDLYSYFFVWLILREYLFFCIPFYENLLKQNYLTHR